MPIIVKYLITALLVVVISEVAKHSGKIGALIASLPLVTVLTLIWLYVDKAPTEKLHSHAYYTFWYVIPTLPMFLVMPWLFDQGWSFWPNLLVNIAMTLVLFAIFAAIMKNFGVDLLP